MKHILISNDDGYLADGLNHLAEHLSTLAPITVVAPDRNRSGAGCSLTLTDPLRMHAVKPNWYMVEGTPTDCVHLAITGALTELPDMVVSGLNSGANLGDDTLYSGTVAAAIEGRFLGYPAMALSMTSYQPQHYQTGAVIAKKIISQLALDTLPNDIVLNVNIPDRPLSEIAGIKVTRLGYRHRAEAVIKGVDPRGMPFYWIGAAGAGQDAGEGTDFAAIEAGFVSITPLKIDLTHHSMLETLTDWAKQVVL